MRRRDFLSTVGGAAIAWPIAVRAQQPRTQVVGFVSISDRETTDKSTTAQAFFQRLDDLGWTPGRNISIEYRFANNKVDYASTPQATHGRTAGAST
jgi:putative ABC transport system substrate-binding protein